MGSPHRVETDGGASRVVATRLARPMDELLTIVAARRGVTRARLVAELVEKGLVEDR